MNKKIAFSLLGLALLGGVVLGEAQIVIDPITKKITIVGLETSSGSVNSGTVTSGILLSGTTTTTGITNQNTGTISTPITTGTEFDQALSRLFSNQITKYNNSGDYRTKDFITREEFAKMVVQSYSTLGYPNEIKNTSCDFKDISTANPELTGYITQACRRGLIKGANGNFMPNKSITRPEAMAILIRMFEGKTSFEAKDPRRSDYYIKGRSLGLTNYGTLNGFDESISRYEVALYIFRLKKIIENQSLKASSILKIQQINSQNTGTTTTTTTSSGNDLTDKFSIIANNISVENDVELQEAIRWMNDNGLTSYQTIAEYKPFEILLREQAAKIFDVFAKTFNFGQDKIAQTLPTSCQFKDINKADGSTIPHIENICKMEILQGGNQIFDPKANLTKGQFITALIRLVNGNKLDENVSPWWKNYYQKALEMGIVGPADAITFDSPITRYETALFLYRFKIKYLFINNLNTDNIENQIISTMSGSVINNSGKQEANIYIDINLIQNGNFEIGYIETFGTRYKVVKTTTEKYFSKNFVRYGDIYNLENNQKIGTVNFVVSNFHVIDGSVRINTSSYKITQSQETNAYYTIKQID